MNYLYTLERDEHFKTHFSFKVPQIFEDDSGKVWMMIDTTGEITIASGYSWNGCDIKVEMFGRLVGTPEGPINHHTGYPVTYHASLLHDVLCQFQDHPNMPLDRKEIDLLFYIQMRQARFKAADLYYLMVRTFGPAYRLL